MVGVINKMLDDNMWSPPFLQNQGFGHWILSNVTSCEKYRPWNLVYL